MLEAAINIIDTPAVSRLVVQLVEGVKRKIMAGVKSLGVVLLWTWSRGGGNVGVNEFHI